VVSEHTNPEELILDLTASNVDLYLTCQKKYKLEQIDGLFPEVEGKALRMGRIFHEGMEVRCKKGTNFANLAITQAYDDIFPSLCQADWFDEDDLTKEVATVKSMMIHAPWDLDDIVEIEKSFHVPLVNMGLKGAYVRGLAGKIDGIVVNKADKAMLIDWKTRSRDRSLSPEVMERNLQASFYFHVVRRMERYPVAGMQFRYISKPTIRQKKTESLDEYLHRVDEAYRTRDDYYDEVDTYRDPNDMKWYSNMQHIINFIEQAYVTNSWIENWRACEGFYGEGCRYLPICNNLPGARDKFLKKGPNHHPELLED
jgi:hypothetical protein